MFDDDLSMDGDGVSGDEDSDGGDEDSNEDDDESSSGSDFAGFQNLYFQTSSLQNFQALSSMFNAWISIFWIVK